MDASWSLSWLLDHALPLNRKERFYTGTVLPGIVCADFGQLHRLTTLMGHPDTVDVSGDPSDPGVVFFTEYGLAESVHGPSVERFAGLSLARDTPDVVFLTTKPTPALFALEAKMYDRPGAGALRQQLELQRQLLDPLAKRLATWLEVEKVPVIHRALLPGPQAEVLDLAPYEMITWEQLRQAYADVAPPYWMAMLTQALERYKDLVARARPNDEERLLGQDIVDRYRAGTLTFTAAGRMLGLKGPHLRADIETGAWKSTLYQVATEHPGSHNPNWFLVQDFVARIDRADAAAHGHGQASSGDPREHQGAVEAFRSALQHSTAVGARVFNEGSVVEFIADASDEALADVQSDELNRIAGLYRHAAEAAQHARAEASNVHNHVSRYEPGD